MTSLWIVGATPGAEALRMLTLAALGLAVLAMGFTMAVLIGRWQNTRTEQHEETQARVWEQPVLEALNGTRSVESVQQLVGPGEALYFIEVLASLARRLPEAERGPLVLLAAPFIDRLTPRLSHHDEAIRVRAVQTLGLLAFGVHATKLLRALDDRSPLVALHAARALSRPGNSALAPQVLQRLPRFTRFHLPLVAAVIAGLGLDAVPALLAAYGDERLPPAARIILANALRLLSAREAAGVAVRYLAVGGDRDLAAASLQLLGDLGAAAHLGAVRPCLRSDQELLRVHAVLAISKLAEPAQLAELEPMLDDPSPRVAFQAARALRRLHDGDTLRGLAAGSGRPAELAAAVLAESAS